jgi:hypothetical protein
MGHSSINVTLDRYGHLLPELDEAIATSFDRSFREASDRRNKVVVHVDSGPHLTICAWHIGTSGTGRRAPPAAFWSSSGTVAVTGFADGAVERTRERTGVEHHCGTCVASSPLLEPRWRLVCQWGYGSDAQFHRCQPGARIDGRSGIPRACSVFGWVTRAWFCRTGNDGRNRYRSGRPADDSRIPVHECATDRAAGRGTDRATD